MTRSVTLWAVLALQTTSACALLGKSEPLELRYLSPESIHERARRPASPAVTAPRDLALYLGRVGSSSHLRERVVFRDADHEVGFYEDRRWTERPEVYVQRALERALFDEGAVTRRVQAASPTLTANLLEFEEVRAPHLGVRLSIAFALRDDRSVLRGRTVTVERPAGEGDAASQPRRVAAAMGDALRAAVDEIVVDVVAGLAALPAPASITK